MNKFNVIIPAYNPGPQLISLVEQLLAANLSSIVIVNDGSSITYDSLFSSIQRLHKKIIILQHPVNLGKGAALKTGLRYVLENFQNDEGVVTADADGQHQVEDIFKIGRQLMQHPGDFILGVRDFSIPNIPYRSKFGNLLTIKLFHLLTGMKISDTQTGLRGIPKNIIPQLLELKNNGYEFELSVLLNLGRLMIKIREIKIKTVYIDKNKSSHFNPLLDSLKIYFVLFRFCFANMFR